MLPAEEIQTMIGAEVAQLRKRLGAGFLGHIEPAVLRRLLADFEQAQADRDENAWCKSKLIEMRYQRDSAFALLRFLMKHRHLQERPGLVARIAKELGE